MSLWRRCKHWAMVKYCVWYYRKTGQVPVLVWLALLDGEY